MKVNIKRFGKLNKAVVRGVLLLLIISVLPVRTQAFTWGTNVNDTVTKTIDKAGITSPITTMSLTFTGFQVSRPADQDMLLIAPDGVHNLEFMSDAGGNTAIGPINFTLSDSGATFVPNGAAIVNGTTYKPGDYGGAETFPGFAGTVNHAQTNGVATFTTAFGAASGLANANGTWTLIIVDDATAGEVSPINSIGQWSLTINGATAANGHIGGSVTDTGGSPLAGTVVTLGGTQNRKLITDANGKYDFENVETNGFYTVRPERANFNFNPFSRTFSQVGNRTEAVFTATSTGDNANPVDTAEYFVRQQYLDVLGREPEEAGFNYWSDKILACGEDLQCANTQRREVAAAFFISAENQASSSYIYDAYSGSLGRRPALSEFTADRGLVVGGDGLDAAKTAFAQNFVQRAEFTARYPATMTAEEFVNALIQSASSSGGNLNDARANLISIYNQSGGDLIAGRAAVVRSLADNEAFKQSQYNEAFVLTEYFAYLHRDIDQGGYDFWVNVLNSGDRGNYRGMVCSFITSTEYQRRFSTVVSRSNGECGN